MGKAAKRKTAAGAPAAAPRRSAPGKSGSIDILVSLSDAAKLIGRTKQWINTLVRDGWIPRNDRGLYKPSDVAQGYVRSILDEKRNATKASAKNRLDNARAAKIEQDTAQAAHLLIDTSEAIAVVDEIFGALKAELDGLPAAVTRDLELRATIEVKLNDILRRAADGLEQKAYALRSRGEASAPDTEDDA